VTDDTVAVDGQKNIGTVDIDDGDRSDLEGEPWC